MWHVICQNIRRDTNQTREHGTIASSFETSRGHPAFHGFAFMPDMSNLVWRAEGQMLGRSAMSKDSHDAIVCVWTIWIDVKLLFFSVYKGRGTIHVLWAMVQRSGHSTCGYHGWSPWRTCFFHVNFLQWDVAITREPPCRFQTTCFQLAQEVTIWFRWKCCI